MIISICQYCQQEFSTYPCHVKRGTKYCSYRCMGDARIGKASYVRDDAHRQKMSEIVKLRDQPENKKRMAEIGSARKGKTLEEIWGTEKATSIRSRMGRSGEDNPNWRGGVRRNKYPYIFFTLRKEIMQRDGYICQNCEMTQEEAQSKDSLGRGLTIHHIDYNKENNLLTNLITLCKWCNSSANSEREKWQSHYSHLLLGA